MTFVPRYLRGMRGWKDAARDELTQCRRLGLAYTASCPVSNLVLQADDARLRGEMISAFCLKSAAEAVSLAQNVAIISARRGHVRCKPRPKSRHS